MCENDDLVKANDEYHKLIWKNSVHPKTFERVAVNPFCCFREGNSLRVVKLSYMAWVMSHSLSEGITRMVVEDPFLLRKNAIYDLSDAYKGKFTCLCMNETESVVFQEFERFLSSEHDISFRERYQLPPLPPDSVPQQKENQAFLRRITVRRD